MANVKLSNVRKSYGSNTILRDVTLEISAGEFVSFLGPSGSGKTTLLRCISGLEVPDTGSSRIEVGSIVFSDKDTFVPPQERNLGMVFQNYAVWPHLTVFDNVAFPLVIRKQKQVEIEKKVKDVLDLVKLEHLKLRFPAELSGGQQQRVALARALVMSPSVLLLDEPLSNLDALLREELGTEIRRLQRSLNLTTILVTHDQKEALSLSDKIVLLKDGRIEAEGTPEQLYFKPPSDFSALFLAGAQLIKMKTGETKSYLPRNWKDGGGKHSIQVVSRLFLGNEYEYLGSTDAFCEPIRFFSQKRHEIGQTVHLDYTA